MPRFFRGDLDELVLPVPRDAVTATEFQSAAAVELAELDPRNQKVTDFVGSAGAALDAGTVHLNVISDQLDAALAEHGALEAEHNTVDFTGKIEEAQAVEGDNQSAAGVADSFTPQPADGAPAPSPVPTTSPPTPSPTAGPGPVMSACPPGFVPSPYEPNACVGADTIGPAGGISPIPPPGPGIRGT